MPWLKIELQAESGSTTVVSDTLTACGAIAVSIEDASDHAVFEEPNQPAMAWPRSRVSGLFAPDTDVAGVLHHVRQRMGKLMPSRIETVADQQWETLWRETSRPIGFGAHLWVCPGGGVAPVPNAITVSIDPGLAFGTGTHATTALCLEWLARQPLTGKTVLDYGCGSGILAIAALKLGAKFAWGVDIDSRALDVSTENAARNAVAERYRALGAESVPRNLAVDILVANILAQPLIDLAPMLSRLVAPAGSLVLSGLLAQQVDLVRSYYAADFALQTRFREDENGRHRWAILIGRQVQPKSR
ncbi:MAG: 50S ribosomal protein L11 methyltransferase [Acidiferrobacterales bacterium]|nr:50S ribosomal protein L11 methyltransferase [Acidiferrobacterales bacterium]